MVAALKSGRNSIGIEIDAAYCKMAEDRLRKENSGMFSTSTLEFIYPAQPSEAAHSKIVVGEKKQKYSAKKKRPTKQHA